MVEHSLAKAEVEGSSPSFRSRLRRSVVTSGVRQSSVQIRYAEGFFFFHRDGLGVQSTVLYRTQKKCILPKDFPWEKATHAWASLSTLFEV